MEPRDLQVLIELNDVDWVFGGGSGHEKRHHHSTHTMAASTTAAAAEAPTELSGERVGNVPPDQDPSLAAHSPRTNCSHLHARVPSPQALPPPNMAFLAGIKSGVNLKAVEEANDRSAVNLENAAPDVRAS